jgi:hypothetical protein
VSITSTGVIQDARGGDAVSVAVREVAGALRGLTAPPRERLARPLLLEDAAIAARADGAG